MPKTCTCHLCEYDRRMTAIMDRGDVAEMRDAIRELLNDLACAGEDLSVAKCKLKGEWPNSRGELLRALARMRQLNREEALAVKTGKFAVKA